MIVGTTGREGQLGGKFTDLDGTGADRGDQRGCIEEDLKRIADRSGCHPDLCRAVGRNRGIRVQVHVQLEFRPVRRPLDHEIATGIQAKGQRTV